MSEISIAELDGYDLVQSPTLDLGDGFQCLKQEGGTNTSKWYQIKQGDEPLGRLQLAYGLKTKEVGFDIEIADSRRGENFGLTTLQRLAGVLGDRGFSLVTGGIDPKSRPYWQHLAEKGLVTPIDATNPQTQYRVPPKTNGSAPPKA